jgi:hypothetical protein
MLRLLASLLAILGAGDHHPARLTVSEPLAFEVWEGRLAGRAARPFHVRVSGRRYLVWPGLSGRFSVRVPHTGAGDGVVTVRRPPDPGLRAAARIAASARPGSQRPQARPGAPLPRGSSHGRCRRLRPSGRWRRGRLERRSRVRGRVHAQAPDHGRGARADRRRAAGDGVLGGVRRSPARRATPRPTRRSSSWAGARRAAQPRWSRRCGGSACATPTCTAAT